MKQAFLLISMMSLGWAAVAQPVLFWSEPTGNGYSADVVAGTYITPSAPSAEPQSWDFSDVTGSSVALFNLAPAETSSFFPLFDSADWVSGTGDQLSFWGYQDDAFTVQGNANSATGITLSFDDPLTQWTYPLEMGALHTDTFALDQMLLGQPYSLEGSLSSEIDAWGSLVTPDGTAFEEVLRGNYVQNYTETYEGDTANWYLNQVMYFVPDSTLAVFFHEELIVTDNSGLTLLEITDVAWYSDPIANVPPVHASTMQAPYPNPAKAGETLTWMLPDGWGYRAIAMDGKVLAEGQAQGPAGTQISTAEWGRGMVLLYPLNPEGQEVGSVSRILMH